MAISTDIIYGNEVRIEDNNSYTAKSLSTLVDAISYIELSRYELEVLEEALADGEDVDLLGVTFRRYYRRGGATVYNAGPILRFRKSVTY